MYAIRHTHSRLIEAPSEQVRRVLDALWSGDRTDPLPRALRAWRKLPDGASVFCAGAQFGHGPFRFVVEECDAQRIYARILTRGFHGYHGFTLHAEASGTRIVHDLVASAALPQWLSWKLLIGAGHDWAVAACLARIAALAEGEQKPYAQPTTPWQLDVFARVRRASRRWSLA
jgi:hypothetical protein